MKNKLTKTKFKSALCAARNLITSRLFGSVIVILVSLGLMSGNAWAGTPALEGTVKDASGRQIRGADVRIEAKNFSKIVKTDANGHYISNGLAVGTYKSLSLSMDQSKHRFSMPGRSWANPLNSTSI